MYTPLPLFPEMNYPVMYNKKKKPLSFSKTHKEMQVERNKDNAELDAAVKPNAENGCLLVYGEQRKKRVLV